MSTMTKEKQFTRSEVEKNHESATTLLIIHDKVYNVHSFLNEHPGGEEILLEHKGQDASNDFNDAGHSNDALELMQKYQIGVIVESEKSNTLPKKTWLGYSKENKDKSDASFYLLIGGIGLAIAILFYVY